MKSKTNVVLIGGATLAVGGIGIGLVLFGSMFMLIGGADGASASTGCSQGEGGPVVEVADRNTPDQVGAYSGEQLTNAAAIIDAGAELGVPVQGQAIGVMTAIGESSLINIDYGDWETSGVRNPDGTPTSSVGLFQQQEWWGTLEERMNPHTSATLFFEALTAVPGWQTLPPTIAAHETQNNADPFHYEPHWDVAVEIVETLTGTEVASNPDEIALAPAGAVGPCSSSGASTGPVSADGWTNPAVGDISSEFGNRTHPVTGESAFHAGDDVSAACGTPVWAAADGVVVHAAGGEYQGRTGNQVIIDHGGGVTTRYGHVLSGTMAVNVGDEVTAGEQIAAVGGDPALDPDGAGTSTGCHLHFEVNLDGEPVDPSDYLADLGITLGAEAEEA